MKINNKTKEDYTTWDGKSITDTCCSCNVVMPKDPKDPSSDSTVDDVSYQFVTISEYVTAATNGVITFSNVPIYEGTYTKNRYTVDTKNVDQKFKKKIARRYRIANCVKMYKKYRDGP